MYTKKKKKKMVKSRVYGNVMACMVYGRVSVMFFFCLVWGRKETCLPRAKDLRKGGGGPRHAVHVIWVGGGGKGGGGGTYIISSKSIVFFSSQKLHLISSLYLYTCKTIKYLGRLQREKRKDRKK